MRRWIAEQRNGCRLAELNRYRWTAAEFLPPTPPIFPPPLHFSRPFSSASDAWALSLFFNNRSVQPAALGAIINVDQREDSHPYVAAALRIVKILDVQREGLHPPRARTGHTYLCGAFSIMCARSQKQVNTFVLFLLLLQPVPPASLFAPFPPAK